MKLVNLTPHAVTLMPQGPDGPAVTVPPSGTVARCDTHRVQVDTIDLDGTSVPVNLTRFGALQGLPAPAPDTLFIVSALAAQAAKALGRTDVVMVDDAVRDADGRIIGAKALARP